MTRTLRGTAAGTALLIGLAGCSGSGSTGPSAQPLSPTETAAAFDSVGTVVGQENDFTANLTLANQYFFGGSGSALFSSDPATSARIAASRLLGPAVSGGAGSGPRISADVIPSQIRGTTYVWNVDSMSYVADSTRTDAPANGVRIVMYQVDRAQSPPLPTTPLSEIGYIDFTDQSSGAMNAVRIQAVLTTTGGDLTLADYTISASSTSSSASVVAQGYVADLTEQVNFDLRLSGTFDPTTSTGSFTYDFGFTAPSQDASVTLTGNFQTSGGTDASVSSTLSLTKGPHTATLTFNVKTSGGTSTANGTIQLNGRTFAVMSGDPTTQGGLTWTKPDGSALTQQEVVALTKIFSDANDFFNAPVELLTPSGA